MKSLIKAIKDLSEYQTLLKTLQEGEVQPGLGLPRAARLPLLSSLHEDLDRVVLLITDRADHALSLFDELGLVEVSTAKFFG